MRGLTLFLMLFVNDLYVPGVPKWLVHTSRLEDGMGLADWVFPGFLFMVGLSIPFAFAVREKRQQTDLQMFSHILIRTISLLLIGVFMYNISVYNAELAGINKYLWATIVYIFIFLIWNNYPKHGHLSRISKGLKLVGLFGLLIMAAIYRSGTVDEVTWMSTGWWGILGIIGWAYLVVSLSYMVFRDSILSAALVWAGFILLNILSQTSYLDFLSPVRSIFGVILNGNAPSMALCGLLVGILLKKYKNDYKRFLSYIIPFGLMCIIIGFILRHWFIISKLQGTPSWAMLCNGISILVFAFLYYLLDIKKWQKWSFAFLPAGQNSLTTYLAPNILYFIIWGLGLNVLFYKQAENAYLAVGGSLFWAFAMVAFAALLAKVNIRLKL